MLYLVLVLTFKDLSGNIDILNLWVGAVFITKNNVLTAILAVLLLCLLTGGGLILYNGIDSSTDTSATKSDVQQKPPVTVSPSNGSDIIDPKTARISADATSGIEWNKFDSSQKFAVVVDGLTLQHKEGNYTELEVTKNNILWLIENIEPYYMLTEGKRMSVKTAIGVWMYNYNYTHPNRHSPEFTR